MAQLKVIIGIGITIGEKTIYFTYILIISGLVNLGLNFVFVPLFSYYEASITTIIANAVNLFLTYKVAQKFFPVKYEINKLLIFYSVLLFTAASIPMIEIRNIFSFSIIIKIMILSITITLPFGFGLVNIDQFRNFVKKNK